MADATGYAMAGSKGDGPYAEIWIGVEEGRITRSSWQTNGCPVAMTCGDLAARVSVGRSLSEARRLEGKDLILFLGGIPEGKEYCAEMAAEAVRLAVDKVLQ